METLPIEIKNTIIDYCDYYGKYVLQKYIFRISTTNIANIIDISQIHIENKCYIYWNKQTKSMIVNVNAKDELDLNELMKTLNLPNYNKLEKFIICGFAAGIKFNVPGSVKIFVSDISNCDISFCDMSKLNRLEFYNEIFIFFTKYYFPKEYHKINNIEDCFMSKKNKTIFVLYLICQPILDHTDIDYILENFEILEIQIFFEDLHNETYFCLLRAAKKITVMNGLNDISIELLNHLTPEITHKISNIIMNSNKNYGNFFKLFPNLTELDFRIPKDYSKTYYFPETITILTINSYRKTPEINLPPNLEKLKLLNFPDLHVQNLSNLTSVSFDSNTQNFEEIVFPSNIKKITCRFSKFTRVYLPENMVSINIINGIIMSKLHSVDRYIYHHSNDIKKTTEIKKMKLNYYDNTIIDFTDYNIEEVFDSIYSNEILEFKLSQHTKILLSKYFSDKYVFFHLNQLIVPLNSVIPEDIKNKVEFILYVIDVWQHYKQN